MKQRAQKRSLQLRDALRHRRVGVGNYYVRVCENPQSSPKCEDPPYNDLIMTHANEIPLVAFAGRGHMSCRRILPHSNYGRVFMVPIVDFRLLRILAPTPAPY